MCPGGLTSLVLSAGHPGGSPWQGSPANKHEQIRHLPLCAGREGSQLRLPPAAPPRLWAFRRSGGLRAAPPPGLVPPTWLLLQCPYPHLANPLQMCILIELLSWRPGGRDRLCNAYLPEFHLLETFWWGFILCARPEGFGILLFLVHAVISWPMQEKSHWMGGKAILPFPDICGA